MPSQDSSLASGCRLCTWSILLALSTAAKVKYLEQVHSSFSSPSSNKTSIISNSNSIFSAEKNLSNSFISTAKTSRYEIDEQMELDDHHQEHNNSEYDDENKSGIPLVGSGAFHILNTDGSCPMPRKEACSVVVNGKLFVIGGRDWKRTSVYDPSKGHWIDLDYPPVDLHHLACVVYQDRYVYIPSSWSGSYPFEATHETMFIYDTENNSWAYGPGLGSRSRGSATAGIYKGKMYVAMGNRGGHGGHATTLGEFDVYDFDEGTWTQLPDAPDARDHVGGSGVFEEQEMLCVGGGRNSGSDNFFGSPIAPVNCFNFSTYIWERRANIPVPRGGVGNIATCQGLLMIAGGEGREEGSWDGGDAFSRVDLYDPVTDSFLEPIFMSIVRHGMGLAKSECSCGNVFYVSGAAGLGDGPLQKSTEVWSPDGAIRDCI